MNSLAGKILRIDEDAGIASDNLYKGSPVYSHGHRNPQGINWYPSKGYMVITEHGPLAHDEINIIKSGGNYGWPNVVGKSEDERYINPVIENVSFETWAPSGASFIKGNEFREFKGDFLVACLRGQRLLRIRFINEDSAFLIEEVLRKSMVG